MFKNLVGTHKPDILDCISNLSSDEVFTPPAIVNQMLDILPTEVWTNPDFKWLDPATKSGVFLREIAMRLMESLKQAIPDEDARREHIFRNMLYGVAITELTGLIARRSLYYSKDASSNFSIVLFDNMQGNVHYSRGVHHYVNGKCWHCGVAQGSLDRGEHLENYAYQFIHDNTKTLKSRYVLEKFGEDMKFDVIIGNPPYQLDTDGFGGQAKPIYNLFVEQAIKLNPKYVSMIIPSRWFAGGMGLNDFREKMLSDKRLRNLVDMTEATDCFPGVEIKGGVCYFLWDASYDGLCKIKTIVTGEVLDEAERDIGAYDIFVRFNKAISILEKVKSKSAKYCNSIAYGLNSFGLATNFNAFEKTSSNANLIVYVRGGTEELKNEKITQGRDLIGKYKVLLSKAYNAGDSYPHQIIGKPIVAGPNTCCTMTYFVAGAFSDEIKALNYERYLKTKFCRFMLSIRKNTQDINKEKLSFVPLFDFDSDLSDEYLYDYFNLSEDEISFIGKTIREMP